MKGEIDTKGTLRIDGRFEGDVRADRVILGEKGAFEGNIHAQSVLIGGTVKGMINASDSIEINTKGRVFGSISALKLIVLEGGILEGTAIMERELREKSSDDVTVSVENTMTMINEGAISPQGG